MRKRCSPMVVAMACVQAIACGAQRRAAQVPKVLSTSSDGLPAAAHTPTMLSVAAPTPTAEHLRLAIIGDYGWQGPDAAAVARLVGSWSPDAVLTLGDNNYPNGAAATLDNNISQYYAPFIRFGPRYRGLWAESGSPTQRFFPALGNHDWHTMGAAAHLDALAPPGNGRYYSHTFGDIDVFVIDSDAHEPDGIDAYSPQANWLKKGLCASSAPVKLVLMHHPPYSSGPHGVHAILQWPFAQWGATMVLAGHDHHYERLSLADITYVVNGAGGAPLRPVTLRPRPGSEQHLTFDRQHGAMLISHGEHGISAHFISVAGEQIDSILLSPPGRGDK